METEASIKAVYVLIEQRRYLLAAEFLSNVVFINLQLSDEEKVYKQHPISLRHFDIPHTRFPHMVVVRDCHGSVIKNELLNLMVVSICFHARYGLPNHHSLSYYSVFFLADY